MLFSDQEGSLLAGIKGAAPDSAGSRELGHLYWSRLSQGISECVRKKSDLSAYLRSERDFVDFGLVPQVLENLPELRENILEKPATPSYCDILFFSDWLALLCTKILQGDKKDMLEKEMRFSLLQIGRLEKEIKDIQQQRRDDIHHGLLLSSKPPGQADVKTNLDALEQLDNYLRQNLKFKKAVSKGTFLSVTDKRSYCNRENSIAALRKKTDGFLNAIEPKELLVIKGYSAQINDNLGRITDLEENTEKMKKDCVALEKKQEGTSPAEIEARIVHEIDYVRDLIRLSAKRLHMESCPFIRDGDKYFTNKELYSCLDRVLEFDPKILHNDRTPIFGKPGALLVPGTGNALYDWKNNVIIVPMLPPVGNFMASVACGAIEYRIDTDETKKFLVSYNQLPDYQNVKSIFTLRSQLTKDYITWMTSEYKGFRNLSKDVRKWFEHEIAPSKNDIAVPPQYQPSVMTTEEFTKLFNACESRLANGLNQASENDLWIAGILNYQRGNFERSIELFKTLFSKNPKNEKALYNLGFACMKLMYKQDAINRFHDYTNLNPQSWWSGVVMEFLRRLQVG
jgi:tetratricopeptide (TPR) repeat protein